MAGYFKFQPRENGQFMFSLELGNEAVLTSEAYTTKAAAMNGIESVKANASDEDHYKRTTTPGGTFRFALHAANGQTIGSSGYFESEAARDDAIESVKENGPGAGLED